jgi:sugar porter (SP) family MFS transporter
MKVFERSPFNVTLLLAATIASLGGLLFGYNTVIISAILVSLPKAWGLGTMHQGLVVSGVLLGAIVGATASGKMADSLGRRDVILGTAAVYVLGTFHTAVASTPIMLIVGRIICGVAIGSTSVTVPLYISEIAPARYRGMLVSINQLAITIGILASFTIGSHIVSHGYGWHSMPLWGVIPAILLGVGALLLPESPRWLMLQDDEDKARRVFVKLGSTDVEADMRHIRINLEATRGMTLPDLFKQPLRRSLVIGVGIFLVQQFSGINAVLYYAPTVFKMAGYATESAGLTAAISLGLVNALATLVSMVLVDRVGRRPLLLTGLVGMIICLVVLGLSVAPGGDTGRLHMVAAMGSLLLFVAFFAVGIGVMGWLITSEIYPQSIRGTAMSLPAIAHWAANLVVSLLFLVILDRIGPDLTFWLFAVVGILGFLFCSSFVPETMGRTLENIEEEWLGKKKEGVGEQNSFRLWLIACFASLGGLISGYEWGVIGGAMLEIRKTWTLSSSQEGMIVSAFLVGATSAVAFSGKLADSFGRRTIVLAVAVFFVTGSYVCGLAPTPEWLAAGRVLIGMSTGVATFAIPMYLSEISPAAIRGALVMMCQLSMVAGGLLASLINILFDYYDQSWRDMFTLVAVPSAIMAVAMLFLPESPSWLLAKDDPGATRRMLRRLGVHSPQETLETMKRDMAASPEVSWRDLFKPWLRLPLVLGVVILMLQEITGHGVMINYGPTIFQMAGFESSRAAMLANTGLGLLDLCMILLSMRFVDRIGRRPLLLTGLMGIIVSLGVLGLGFFLMDSGFSGPFLKGLIVGSLMTYVAAFGISLGPVCGLIVSELYPLAIKGLGMSIAACFCLGSAALMSYTFPRLVAVLGNGGAFWLYGLVSAAAWVFCFALAPETKGKTLMEIERLWLNRRPDQEPG